MTRFHGRYLHDHLGRSGLAALLEEWTQEGFERVQQPPDIAEQLSSWLSAVDAIKLSRALNDIEVAPQRGKPVDARAMEAIIHAAKAEVIGLMATPVSPARPMSGRAAHVAFGHAERQPPTDPAALIQRYVGLQKKMGTKLAMVRGQMRQWLREASPALRQLAVLDAVMEQMLDAREQRLWASLPAHLERRLANLQQRHQQVLQSSGEPHEHVDGNPEDDWLGVIEKNLQALLLAEMQVRLQPVMGLLEAAHNEKTGQQE